MLGAQMRRRDAGPVRVVGSSDAKPGDTSVSTLISLAVTCSTKQAMHFPGSDSPQIDSQATSQAVDLVANFGPWRIWRLYRFACSGRTSAAASPVRFASSIRLGWAAGWCVF